MRPGWVEPPPCITRYQWLGLARMEQMGNCPQIFSSSNYVKLHPLSRRWTGARDLFSFYIWSRAEQQQRWCYLFGGEDFWSGWAGLGWTGLGWVQEGILNSNLCQDWKTGLNEGRPRGATALPQSYKYFKINFK